MTAPALWVWNGSPDDTLDVMRYVLATGEDILNQPVVRAYVQELKELVWALQADLDRSDQRLTGVRSRLTAAGVPEVEPYPIDDALDDRERSLRAGGRVLSLAERLDRPFARLHDLESFRADVMAGCDIERNGKVYRQVPVEPEGE